MPDNASKKTFAQRVAGSFLYSGVGNAISKVINAGALLYTLKLVTPEDLGLASIVLAILAILSAVTELGLGVALVQAEKPTRDQTDSLFWLSLVVSGGFYLLLFAAAPLVTWFYDEARLTSLLRVQSLTILIFSLYFVSRTRMERDLQFGRLAIVDNLALLFASATMVVLAYKGCGVWAFIIAELAQRTSQGILYQFCRPFVPRLRFNFSEIRNMVGFGLYASGSRLLYNFYINVDYLIVGKVFSGEILGIYTLAYRVVSDPVRALATIVNQVAYPAFARLQSQMDRLRKYFFTVARMSMTLIGNVLLVVVIFFEPILRLLDYHQWMGAVPLVYVFAALGVIRSVAPLVPQLLNAVGRARQNFFYSLACSMLMPIAFLVGSRFGVTGVAVGWLIAYPIVVTILFHFGARAVEMEFFAFLPRIFAGLVVVVPVALIGVGLRLLLLNGIGLPLLSGTVIGVAATLLLALAAGYLRERETIRAVLKKNNEKEE
jgi:O-antigen/teichoic acid export membrane protein